MGEEVTTSEANKEFNSKQYFLILFGVLLFLLLLFTDRTFLQGKRSGDVKPEVASTYPSIQAGSEFEKNLKSLENKFSSEKDSVEKMKLLQDIISVSIKENRVDIAAYYQEKILAIDSTNLQLRNCAILYQQALQSQIVQADSNWAIKYSNKAVLYTEKLVSAFPDSLDFQTSLGAMMVQGKDPSKLMLGIQKLKEVLSKDPTNYNANLNLGLFSIQSGQIDKAEIRFKDALKSKPKDARILFYLGGLYLDMKKTEEGKKLLLQAKENCQDSVLILKIEEKLKK